MQYEYLRQYPNTPRQATVTGELNTVKNAKDILPQDGRTCLIWLYDSNGIVVRKTTGYLLHEVWRTYAGDPICIAPEIEIKWQYINE